MGFTPPQTVEAGSPTVWAGHFAQDTFESRPDARADLELLSLKCIFRQIAARKTQRQRWHLYHVNAIADALTLSEGTDV